MSQPTTTFDLIQQDVPLALLFDLAGFGPSSTELYRDERPENTRRPSLQHSESFAS